MNLSSFTVKALAASLLLATTGLAYANGYASNHPAPPPPRVDFKGMKGEAPCPPPPALLDGFYVGAQVGYDSYKFHQNVGVQPLIYANPTSYATGGVGGLFLGYGKYFWDMWYIGLEVYGNYGDPDTSYAATIPPINLASYNGKFSARGNWGIVAIPGIKLADTLLAYSKLGYNWSNLQVNEGIVPITQPGFNRNTSRNANAFLWGFGLESLVWAEWSLRAEFVHGNLSSIGAFSTFKPSFNEFMLGVSYHFYQI